MDACKQDSDAAVAAAQPTAGSWVHWGLTRDGDVAGQLRPSALPLQPLLEIHLNVGWSAKAAGCCFTDEPAA